MSPNPKAGLGERHNNISEMTVQLRHIDNRQLSSVYSTVDIGVTTLIFTTVTPIDFVFRHRWIHYSVFLVVLDKFGIRRH